MGNLLPPFWRKRHAQFSNDDTTPRLRLEDGGTIKGTLWKVAGQIEEHADLSGIACGKDGYGLIVTDEGSHVHPFLLERENRTLSLHDPGVELLRRGEEADLEGLCCDGEVFYAVGSHAIGRKIPDHQPSRHHLYRLWLKNGELRHEISHALEPLIEADGLLGRHYLKRLNRDERGVDIEGIAHTSSERLLIGLRSPVLDGQAHLLSIDVEALFGRKGSRQDTAERYGLPLGDGAGIRDLAWLPEGVLILAGPSTDDDDPPFTLWRWSGRRKLERLGVFEHGADAKAEGLLVLGSAGGKLELLVVFDGVSHGGMHQFDLPWRN